MGRAHRTRGSAAASRGLDALLGSRRGSATAQAARDQQELAAARDRQVRIGRLLDTARSGLPAAALAGWAGELADLECGAEHARYPEAIDALRAGMSDRGAVPAIALLAAHDGAYAAGPGAVVLDALCLHAARGDLSKTDAALAVNTLFAAGRPMADRQALAPLAGALAGWVAFNPAAAAIPAQAMALICSVSERELLNGPLREWLDVLSARLRAGSGGEPVRRRVQTALDRAAQADPRWAQLRGWLDEL